MKPLISVCIPTYEMYGEGYRLLKRNLEILSIQNFKNFEIVVTDNSEDFKIKELCENYQGVLNIKYYKNSQKGIAKNTNEAMRLAKGNIIKLLSMDDYLSSKDSLKDIVDNFKGNWLVTGCAHDTGNGDHIKIHFPVYNKKIYLGKNTIGSPSVLAITNENPMMFDENLTWMNDCEYYKRLYEKYGEPNILNKVNVIIGIGKHQTTKHMSWKAKRNEKKYLKQKYKKRHFVFKKLSW